MYYRLDVQCSVSERRIGIVYSPVCSSGFGGLLIGLFQQEKWLECEADQLCQIVPELMHDSPVCLYGMDHMCRDHKIFTALQLCRLPP